MSPTLKTQSGFNYKRAFMGSLVIAVIGAAILFRGFAATEDLSTYFPNTSFYKSYYLAGKNYSATPASPAVLWFDELGNGKFKMYNTGPSDPQRRCHWDLFTWTDTAVGYSETRNTCNGANNDIKYSPAINYMPHYWNGTYTSATGTSAASYYSGGVLKCKGTNTWKAEVIGWVEISPGVKAIQTKTTQTTKWTWGSDTSGCEEGYTSKYEDNLYLLANVPVIGGSYAKGIKRTVGGNLDNYDKYKKWDWDIWMDNWTRLPSVN